MKKIIIISLSALLYICLAQARPPKLTKNWVKTLDSLNHTEEFNKVERTSDDVKSFPYDREVIDNAFAVGLTQFHSRRNGSVRHPTEDRNIWIQTEWYSPDYRMGEAMRYLTFVSSNKEHHGYIGPDGKTTLLEHTIAHFKSVLTGGNEPSVSGTGLSAHGYLPVLAALTQAKLNIPEIWNELSVKEKKRSDLLMQGALFAIYYAASDMGRGNRGLNQDFNYNRAWEANHRIGILSIPMVYYYFQGEYKEFVGSGYFTGDGGKADRGIVGWMNNFIHNFNYEQFTKKLEDADMSMLLNCFSNAGLAEVQEVAARIKPEGMTYNISGASNSRYGLTISVTLSERIGDWIIAYSDYAFNGDRKSVV